LLATAAVVVAAVIVDDRHRYEHSVDFFSVGLFGMVAVALVVIWFGAIGVSAWLSMRDAAKRRP
jgi:hypothetical protein